MLKRSFWLLATLFFFLGINSGNAQTQGCLISGQLWVYTTGGTLVPTACGWRTPAVGASTWTTAQKNMCTSGGGTSGSWIGSACPLDDYLPFFGGILASIGLFYLRKQHLAASTNQL